MPGKLLIGSWGGTGCVYASMPPVRRSQSPPEFCLSCVVTIITACVDDVWTPLGHRTSVTRCTRYHFVKFAPGRLLIEYTATVFTDNIYLDKLARANHFCSPCARAQAFCFMINRTCRHSSVVTVCFPRPVYIQPVSFCFLITGVSLFLCFSVSMLVRLRDKKLSCCRETARCFLSLNISLSHSRSLKGRSKGHP